MKKLNILVHPKYPVNLKNNQLPSYCSLALLSLDSETKTTKTYKPIGTSTTCKDFIGDGLFHNFTGQPTPYCHKDELIGPFIILFICENKKVAATFHKKLKIINNLEKKCGVQLTSFELQDNFVVATADPFWRESTLAASTFIQLCRFCLTPSKARSILSQIKVVAANDKLRDSCYAKGILGSEMLDIEFLVKNMDKVSGVNKFTDYNDEKCKGKTGTFTFNREVNILGKNLKGAVRGGNHDHHSTHGICNFAKELKSLFTSKNNHEILITQPFFGRAARYANLLPKNRVKKHLHLFT